jgi:hypothetical protein
MKNNKFTLLIAAFALMFSLQTKAQLGIQVGYNFSKIDGYEWSGADEKYLPNLCAGLFFEKDLVPFLDLRVGALYSPKGSRYTQGDLYQKVFLNYIEVPLQVKAKVGPLYALAGGYGGYALNGKVKSKYDNGGLVLESDEDIDFDDDQVKRIDFGLKFGAGMQYGIGPLKIFAQGEYSLGLANISDGDEDYKNKVIGISAGVIIKL